jgi:hypothetical protein
VSHGTGMTRSRIASGASTKDGERQRVKGDFTNARNTYLTAVSHLVELHDGIAEARVNMQHAKDNQKGIETGWRPSGKNAEERKAALQDFRESDQQWCALQDEIIECETAIKRSEPDIVRTEYDIRTARYDMEMAIAEMRVIAGMDEYRHER